MRYGLHAALLFIVYFVTAKLGLMMDAVSGFASLVWPPAGIALAALLIYGRRLWPAIALAAFLANWAHGALPLTALGIAAGNTIEAVAGAFFLRCAGFKHGFDRAEDTLAFVCLAAGMSTLFSATAGVLSLEVSGMLPASGTRATWFAWWLGDALGDLIVAPLLLTWHEWFRERKTPARSTEAVLLLLATAFIGYILFGSVFGARAGNQPLSYVIFLPLIWAALRFGPVGAVSTLFLSSVIAVWGTMRGIGPFAMGSASESLIFLQIFMGVAAVTTMILASVVAERRHAEGILSRQAEEALRYQAALLALAKTDYADLGAAFRGITEMDSRTMGIERVSVWFFNEDHSEIVCEDLYRVSVNAHEKGLCLKAVDYPRYFRALEESRSVAAHDAQSDPRTSEFTEGYLQPLGISSMLDVPIRLRGQVIGVLCHEHVGPARDWTAQDQDFAASVSEAVTLVILGIERRRAEEELKRSNKELEQFAYVTSHDLRDPLQKIIGFGDLLKAHYAEALGEKGGDYIARMQNAVTRMNRLIEDILAFSRAATAVEAFETVDLREAVQEALSNLELQIVQSKAKIHVGKLPAVRADRVQMIQLFQNLVSNALKFRKTEDPPKVSIEGRAADAAVEVSVSDNGVGFDEKYAERIFKPFERLYARGEYDGSGIGLAICHKIVERHHGRITVSSAPGRGSVFTVTLPAAEKV